MDTCNSLIEELRRNRNVVPQNEGLSFSRDIKRMLNDGDKSSISNRDRRKLPPPQTRSKK